MENLIKQAEEILHEPTLLEGFEALHIALDIALTGNDELIKDLDNGRR